MVYKTADDQLTTLQVGERTRQLLERTKEPVRVESLLGLSGEGAGPEVSLAAIQTLVRVGLLAEVRPS